MRHAFRRSKGVASLLLATLLCLAPLAARDLIFDHLTMEDGLVDNAVSGVVQDRRGYLWFGTQNGLNRYDGRSFLVFDNDPFDPNSLPHKQIQTLYLDPLEPWLWIGTYEGLSRMHLETREFRNFTSDPLQSPNPLSNGIVTAVIRQGEDAIWVGTLEGLNRIDLKTGRVRFYLHDPEDPASLPHDSVRSLELDPQNRLWVGTYGGLSLYDPDKEAFRSFRADPSREDALPSPYVMALKNAPQGKLWVGCWEGGLSLFDPETGRVIRRIPLEENLYLLYPEGEDRLWIGTWGGGLYLLRPGNGALTHYEPDQDARYKLNHGVVYSFIKDRSGLYWIGTNGGGVNKVNPRKKDFRYLYHLSGDPDSLPLDNISVLLEDRRGRLWAGTYNFGLWRFSNEDPFGTLTGWMPSEESGSIAHKGVRTLLEDSRGNIWVGSLGGLDLFDPLTERFRHISLEGLGTDDTLEPFIHAIEEDVDGTFWFGTFHSGVIHWSPQEGVLGVYSYRSDDPALSNNLVKEIFLDSFGVLWVGTNRGLNRFDRDAGRFRSYYHDGADRRTLSGNSISVILEDSRQRLWIGTEGGGINLYDRETGRFQAVTREDGLISNHIQSVLEDHRERLWIATINGINIMEMDSRRLLTLDSSDGIGSSKMDPGAVKGRSGHLYFGSREGILRLEPTLFQNNPLAPSLWFNEVHVMGEGVPFHEHLREGTPLVLPWDKNYLTFEFAALDFAAPTHNLYKYRMEGLDRDWIDSGSRNYASYSNLKPGRYVFSVKGANSDGVWNEESLELAILIRRPPWQQKWFILIYVVMGLLLFVLFSNIQANYLLKKKLKDAESSRMNLQDLNLRLKEMAWNDSLTGLANRRFFDLSLQNLWSLALREQKSLTVLMIDVDFFKAYNDYYGHRMGDEALRKTAEIIRSIAKRDTDTVCRYGGEEFSVLMYDTSMDEARSLCEGMLWQFERENIPHEMSGAASYLSISIGLAETVPRLSQDPENLIRGADKALYRAKEKGRNRMESALAAEVEHWDE